MTPLSTLGLAIGIALIASTLAVIAIREPLRRQLDTLCANGTAATFWTRIAVTVLYLLPLFVVLVFAVPDVSRLDLTFAEIARRAIASAAFALVAIVIGMGLRLARVRPAPPPRTLER